MNSPLPSQSPGALGLESWGPYDKNPLTSSIVGGTPGSVRGTWPLGYVQDVFQSWMTGDPLENTTEPTAPAVAQNAGFGFDPNAVSPWYTRVGVMLIGIIVIALGVYWFVKAGG